jgi:uncharacterized metal-binding protein YceD (DUF177 family)
MPLAFNVRHLDRGDLRLKGELEASELGLDELDELIHVAGPVRYDLEVSLQEQGFLLQGRLSVELRCECARCLRPYELLVDLPDWSCLLPSEGEDKVLVTNDCVDLTPYLREDIVLSLPQHPLCEPECGGFHQTPPGGLNQASGASQTDEPSSAWSGLNKLKL